MCQQWNKQTRRGRERELKSAVQLELDTTSIIEDLSDAREEERGRKQQNPVNTNSFLTSPSKLKVLKIVSLYLHVAKPIIPVYIFICFSVKLRKDINLFYPTPFYKNYKMNVPAS